MKKLAGSHSSRELLAERESYNERLFQRCEFIVELYRNGDPAFTTQFINFSNTDFNRLSRDPSGFITGLVDTVFEVIKQNKKDSVYFSALRVLTNYFMKGTRDSIETMVKKHSLKMLFLSLSESDSDQELDYFYKMLYNYSCFHGGLCDIFNLPTIICWKMKGMCLDTLYLVVYSVLNKENISIYSEIILMFVNDGLESCEADVLRGSCWILTKLIRKTDPSILFSSTFIDRFNKLLLCEPIVLVSVLATLRYVVTAIETVSVRVSDQLSITFEAFFISVSFPFSYICDWLQQDSDDLKKISMWLISSLLSHMDKSSLTVIEESVLSSILIDQLDESSYGTKLQVLSCLGEMVLVCSGEFTNRMMQYEISPSFFEFFDDDPEFFSSVIAKLYRVSEKNGRTAELIQYFADYDLEDKCHLYKKSEEVEYLEALFT